MILTSDAFGYGEEIPAKYTCDGENISPELSWDSFPSQTKSFALTCDDPDAPSGGWVHWVVYNIPADINSLQERMPSDSILQNGINQGLTDFRTTGYGGPCPPSGKHRYFFKIYALDENLVLEPGMEMDDLMKAISPHIIASGELMGVYSRKR
ncbi:YbhB/YbcL family Raf kinase inhibitor-like protein [candidate division WOR-3 bacterium]|nr:YbhB/YbcL family Raf kinase inhibitor-like protein [candidate division WOR-3 bacterium]